MLFVDTQKLCDMRRVTISVLEEQVTSLLDRVAVLEKENEELKARQGQPPITNSDADHFMMGATSSIFSLPSAAIEPKAITHFDKKPTKRRIFDVQSMDVDDDDSTKTATIYGPKNIRSDIPQWFSFAFSVLTNVCGIQFPPQVNSLYEFCGSQNGEIFQTFWLWMVKVVEKIMLLERVFWTTKNENSFV